MTSEGYSGSDYVLLSYDVRGARRSAAVEVCRIIFGRRRGGDAAAERKKEAGFIHRPGVVWVGQSVLFLPPRDAEELSQRIRGLGARVALARVPVSRASLEAFRRPR
ncbi:MAG: hypothetical protein A3K65_05965 [Euryarchaeota archaeon RBG_16_68_12]|nr:MAG: hypothetical protein A3K65_05965 [Euryarchaeota archaeon RBG_16_68_12]